MAVLPSHGDTSWFVHDRFGLFIHWGLYALPACHEWVKQFGEFDKRALSRLTGIAEWMKRHSRSIYGCTAEFPTPPGCRLTYNPATRRLYVHVLTWPVGQLHLDGFAGKVEYARLLNDASEIRMTEEVANGAGGVGSWAARAVRVARWFCTCR